MMKENFVCDCCGTVFAIFGDELGKEIVCPHCRSLVAEAEEEQDDEDQEHQDRASDAEELDDDDPDDD